MLKRKQTKDLRMAAKSQSTVSSFFARGTISSQSPATGFSPHHLELSRSNSLLSSTLRSKHEFDDVSSSDTSHDLIEVNNFSNLALAQTFNPSTERVQRKTQSTRFTRSLPPEVIYIKDEDEPVAAKTVPLRIREGIGIESEREAKPSLKRTPTDLFDQATTLPRKVPKMLSPDLLLAEDAPRLESTKLSDEQAKVIKAVLKDRKSVFFTGSAGTGKSVVLRELVNQLRTKYGDNYVGITASTGMAACNINGLTLHKFLAIGLGKDDVKTMVKKIERNNLIATKWRTLKVLIIDEISMIDGYLFEKLDRVAQELRGNEKPFGGIQLVCSGDFFQLPPIVERGLKPVFCFETEAWQSTIKTTIVLRTVFRQKGDAELIDMLNALRCGKIDEPTNKRFKLLSRTVIYDDGIEPTELYPTRYEVRLANQQRLGQLNTGYRIYRASDICRNDVEKKQLDNLMCDSMLELKEGAQVMYLVNLSPTIVNGSMGTVVLFTTMTIWIVARNVYGIYGLSDPVIMDEIRLASGRVGRKPGEWLESELEAFRKVPKSRQGSFNELLKASNGAKVEDIYPVVKFGEDEYIFVERHEFTIDGKSKKEEDKIKRIQVPLILSWAMSIHKAQGQTIQRLKINLKKVFEIGQVYVAISRAVTKEQLQILNFEASKVTVSPAVQDYYARIGGI